MEIIPMEKALFDTEAVVDVAIQNALFARVRQYTGINMATRKWTLLHGRLRRRLQALSLSNYAEYLKMLDCSSDEVGHFIDLVTTNETSFFRTQRIWDYLRDSYLPAWCEQHPGATLQVWSAAASTGEESYTAGMLFEEFRQVEKHFRYRILGTDIAQRVLDVGRAGCYSGRNIDGLRKAHPHMLDKYFQADGEAYTVSADIRSHVSYRRHNLYERLEHDTPFDLVLLRNVLIYFDEQGQEKVVENVRRNMASDAVLILGESESINRIRTGFSYQQPLIYTNSGKPA